MFRTLLVALLIAAPSLVSAQVFKLEELNTRQITALDRAKTVVLMTGGLLEEHGPYLPSGNDRYMTAWQADRLAEAIAARPGWTVVTFPMIPLGVQSANHIGGKYQFPGSYNVRHSTLRAVYMELADALGADGFRWIFVVDAHGGPLNSLALDDASAYFGDTYKGRMVNLSGLMAYRQHSEAGIGDPQATKEEGFTVHGGADEHSMTLFTRPDLVAGDFRNAASVTGQDFGHLVRLARAEGWPGYFGAPKYANAAAGARNQTSSAKALIDSATRILDGADPASWSRYWTIMSGDASVKLINDASLAHEAEQSRRHEGWLRKRSAGKQ